ncbi:MAG: hypothetical protein AAF682_09710 [Planctomycetota bacterium]
MKLALSLAALAGVILLAQSTSPTLDAQVAVGAPSASGQAGLIKVDTGWPPKPADIVNVDSCNHPGATGTSGCNITMGPSQVHVAFTVPADHWLVVTNFEEGSNTSASDKIVTLVEVAGGVTTVKRGHDFSGVEAGTDDSESGPYVSPVGLVFAPGSEVGLRTTAAAPATIFLNYTLTGYLVDA